MIEDGAERESGGEGGTGEQAPSHDGPVPVTPPSSALMVWVLGSP